MRPFEQLPLLSQPGSSGVHTVRTPSSARCQFLLDLNCVHPVKGSVYLPGYMYRKVSTGGIPGRVAYAYLTLPATLGLNSATSASLCGRARLKAVHFDPTPRRAGSLPQLAGTRAYESSRHHEAVSQRAIHRAYRPPHPPRPRLRLPLRPRPPPVGRLPHPAGQFRLTFPVVRLVIPVPVRTLTLSRVERDFKRPVRPAGEAGRIRVRLRSRQSDESVRVQDDGLGGAQGCCKDVPEAIFEEAKCGCENF